MAHQLKPVCKKHSPRSKWTLIGAGPIIATLTDGSKCCFEPSAKIWGLQNGSVCLEGKGRYVSRNGSPRSMPAGKQYALPKVIDYSPPPSGSICSKRIGLGGVMSGPNDFRAKAEQGYAKAQFDLGLCYANGVGVVGRDFKQAAKWFRKAAEQGYARAQFNLAVYYEHGAGVGKDLKQAAKWFRKAAEQGYTKAQICFIYGSPNGKAWART